MIHGDDAVQAEVACREKAEAVGGTYVSPYNDFQVGAGLVKSRGRGGT